MPDFDSPQHPILYRAISKKGALDDPTLAFLRRGDEEGLSVLLSVNCSPSVCEANQCFGFNKCFGEYGLASDKIEGLGLRIKLDTPGEPDYSENHAEIIGVPIWEGETTQLAEYWASLIADTKPSRRIADPPFKQPKK
jgi:hypothetical protein